MQYNMVASVKSVKWGNASKPEHDKEIHVFIIISIIHKQTTPLM